MKYASEMLFKYSELRDTIVSTYRLANGSRPEVLQILVNDYNLVIKDYSVCPGQFGTMLGSLLVYREKKALLRLQGIKGIPNYYRCDSSRVLITSHCDAVIASSVEGEIQWDEFELALRALLREMHDRGVVHCDLRSPGNVLIDEDNKPYIVDFVASFSNSKWNPLWNILFEQAKKADYSSILKIKNNIYPELLSDLDKLQHEKDASKGSLFRLVSSKLRRITQFILGTGKYL